MSDSANRYAPSPRFLDAIALLLLAIAVLTVYYPHQILTSNVVLLAGDFSSLHQRRIEFAQSALFGPEHRLPSWYPREMLGTPFWSNLQNFPLIPTRLPLLFLEPWHAYAVGVSIAAVLSAWFTFLYCRLLAVGRVGAVAASWTFACAGFFASRVFSGHLPLLEAYPALPLLLWLAERAIRADNSSRLRWSLLAIALATGCIAVAGHPQLPIYAASATVLFVAARSFNRRGGMIVASMAVGTLCMSFALVPMAELIARSTRLLSLDRADNDFAFPVARLKSFVLPWADGWPPGITHAAQNVPFKLGPDPLFLDSVCYVGLIPMFAFAALLIRAMTMRRMPARPWLIITAIGIVALIFAFPLWRETIPTGPWTILRSPARQVYLTTFSLSIAIGVGVDAVLRVASKKRGPMRFVFFSTVLALLILHAIDLTRHARAYVHVGPAPAVGPAPDPSDSVPEYRVAIDATLVHPFNRRMDDVGVFDSILLARPYRALLALAGLPPKLNEQLINGSDLGPRALAWAGALYVITPPGHLSGFELLDHSDSLAMYKVPNPLPRAGFVPASGARLMSEDAAVDALRAGAKPDPNVIFIPPGVNIPGGQPTVSSPSTVKYSRPTTDEIRLDVHAADHGFVRVLEAWDPGWHATTDGTSADLLLADGFVMAIRVEPGSHEIHLKYSTPGMALGIMFTIAGIGLLVALLWFVPRLDRLP